MPKKLPRIRHRRRFFDVRSTRTLLGQKYFVIGEYGRRGKVIEHVLHPDGTGRHEDLVIHVLDDSRDNRKRVENLKRAKGKSLPFARVLADIRKSGSIHVVVEYQEGNTLRGHLQSTKVISPYKAVVLNNQLVNQVCNFMRTAGVIHGDISPDNLIVARDLTRLNLIDFGSSFRYSESQKRSAGDGYKPIYLAPELFSEGAPDHLSEQFSCSMVFYEMISRQVAYSGLGGNISQTPSSEVILPLTPVSELNDNQKLNFPKHIWPAINSYLETTLAIDPSRRFQTKGEWQEAARHLAWLVDPKNISLPKRKSWVEKMFDLLTKQSRKSDVNFF